LFSISIIIYGFKIQRGLITTRYFQVPKITLAQFPHVSNESHPLPLSKKSPAKRKRRDKKKEREL